MTFGQPFWFWAFALFPVLLLCFVQNERRREKMLRLLVAARLQQRLVGTVSIVRRRLRFALLLLSLACVIVSLAQPRLGYTWEQSKRKGRDVLIAIDCSRSMLATDLAPNRLGRAKLAAQDFIGQLQGDRIGLIAFAGSAFLQAPLTIDYGAVLNSLTELDTTVIPRGGTNIAAAIKEAVDAFGKGESDNRCLLIFTDGEELDADGLAAAAAQKDKIKIFTVGLGSPDGSLIPLPGQDGGTTFLKDESGQIVKSKLDEGRLRGIAEATGGFYVHLLHGPAEMQQIVRTGLGQMKEQEIDARMSRRPIQRYQWPLAAGLVLLIGSTLISERKRPARRKIGAVSLAAIVLLGFLPTAFGAKNSGVEAYERQDYQGAMGEFGRQLQRMKDSEALHFNLGTAAYKSGDFGKALEAFAKAVTSSDPQLRGAAEYNLGNTLFQRGVVAAEKDRKVREWKDALQHYEQALQVEPKNRNAEYNRDVVRKLLAELENQPPEPDQQKQEDKKDEEKKDDKDKKEQQESQGEQQDKDQANKDQPPKHQESKKAQEGEPEDQPQNGSSDKKDQQAKNQGKEGKDAPAQPQNTGKEGEKKEAKDDPTSPGQKAPSPNDSNKQEQPAPAPEQADKKRTGDIRAQGDPQPNDPQQEAAAEAEAAEHGKMTEAQAKTLLESLKSEDDRVQLKPGERRPARTFRDW
jgi:Ca-activated chloride channel family protein